MNGVARTTAEWNDLGKRWVVYRGNGGTMADFARSIRVVESSLTTALRRLGYNTKHITKVQRG